MLLTVGLVTRIRGRVGVDFDAVAGHDPGASAGAGVESCAEFGRGWSWEWGRGGGGSRSCRGGGGRGGLFGCCRVMSVGVTLGVVDGLGGRGC